MMKQKMITLDDETSKLAAQKINFSQWVRDKLRSERNKSELDSEMKIDQFSKVTSTVNMSSAELLYHLEQRSEAEITALVSILRGSLNL
jgi:predicted membrane chloride channel (bestrophin family)